MSAAIRIAMWSGPRNISTAMMRSFENRGDCAVSDEPLYAHYLHATGMDHPGRETVIAAGETDWQRVAATLTGPIPQQQPIWYQKHMSHHLLPHIAHDWVHRLTNAFLIRDPAEVVASYLKKRDQVTPEDIGLPQEVQLFEELADRTGIAPPVVDTDEFLKSPEAHLRLLCERLGIAFTERMLAWPAGPRASDGVWAPHWYEAVWQSTGFEPWRPRHVILDDVGRRVVDACRPLHERLRRHRLRVPAADLPA